MDRKQQVKRSNDILYFIWRVKAVLIRQIEKMYFKTNKHARKYLLALEKKGLLTHTAVMMPGTSPGTYPEKVYFLTYAAIQHLKKAGFVVSRYKLHRQAMHHDLTVTDILIYIIQNFEGFKDYKTDYQLRREIHKHKKKFRTPDLTFVDKNGRKYLVEYQLTDKTSKIVKDYISDYLAYEELKRHDVLYVVREKRVKWYAEIFEKSDLKNWHIMTFDHNEGLKTIIES
jgi:hypothetical protein